MEYRLNIKEKSITIPPIMRMQDTSFVFLMGECPGLLYAYTKQNAFTHIKESLDGDDMLCGVARTFMGGGMVYDNCDGYIESQPLVEWLGEEGDTYIVFYDNYHNRYAFMNEKVFPITDGAYKNHEISTYDFRRLAALTNDIVISLLDGSGKAFGEIEIALLSNMQSLIFDIEKQCKWNDDIFLEINCVERDLEYIEDLAWSKLIGTEYEEVKRMRNRIEFDTKEIQERIYDNKVEKGWNVTNVEKELCLLQGEISEFYEAYRKKLSTLGEELADVAIYIFGIAEILDIDLGDEITKKIEINEKRQYKMIDGVNTRISE